jgi:methionyl-tRNA formyltransferase
MRIIILTSSVYGTAAHHLPYLIGNKNIEVVMVVLSEGIIKNKRKYYLQKLRKIVRIGLLGAINGIRMRKWFNEDIKKYTHFDHLEIICKKHSIPFERTPNVNSTFTHELFKKANADLGISLGNGYIGKRIFDLPTYGMINIHHEILPDFQNAQSVIWQLYHGSADSGYTIHQIDAKIDTGAILYQQRVPIVFKNTLKDTIAHTSAILLAQSIKGLNHLLDNFQELRSKSQKQAQGKAYTTPTIWEYARIVNQYRKLKKSRPFISESHTDQTAASS